MALLKKLLSSGTNELIKNVSNIIDDLHNSKEEKDKLKIELEKTIKEYNSKLDLEVTKRWESDNLQSSWLPRNIRPLVLAWLVVSTTLLIFIDAGVIDFNVDNEWKSTLTAILTITIGAYFGSRGIEKIKTK